MTERQFVNGEFTELDSPELRSLRLSCLHEANETARLGLAHNVYQTAERYVAWVKGEKLEDPNAGLDFRQRLEGLVLEFLREERSDARRIMNDVAEWFTGFEKQHPEPQEDTESYGGAFFADGTPSEQAPRQSAFTPHSDVPPMVHKDIRS